MITVKISGYMAIQRHFKNVAHDNIARCLVLVAGALLYQSSQKQIKNVYVWKYVWRRYLISNGVVDNSAGGC